MKQLHAQIVDLADAYCRATGTSRKTLSTRVFNGGHRLDGIAANHNLQTETYHRALDWFEAHWPDGEPWPSGILRAASFREASDG